MARIGRVEVEIVTTGFAEFTEMVNRATAAIKRFNWDYQGHETRCVTGHDGVTRVQHRRRA